MQCVAALTRGKIYCTSGSRTIHTRSDLKPVLQWSKTSPDLQLPLGYHKHPDFPLIHISLGAHVELYVRVDVTLQALELVATA